MCCMSKLKTPKKHGNLIIKEFIKESLITNDVYYLATCDCGQNLVITLSDIERGLVNSCIKCDFRGKTNYRENEVASYVNPIGSIPFGYDVIVLKRAGGNIKNPEYVVECFGRIHVVQASHLYPNEKKISFK